MTALDRIFEAAAEARAAGVPAPAARPSQRRWAEEAGSGAGLPGVRAQGIQLRAAGTEGALNFAGFASVYNRGYEMWDMFGPYSEQVTSGAGAASLARADLDVPLVLAHDPMRIIASTTQGTLVVEEKSVDDTEGLHVEATLDMRNADTQYIVPKLEAGLIDEMSFRFRIEAGSWSADWTEYHIERYDIHRGDVAIVKYGANPHTQGAGLRSLALGDIMLALHDLTDAQAREVENKLHALRKDRGLDGAPAAVRSSAQCEALATLGLA